MGGADLKRRFERNKGKCNIKYLVPGWIAAALSLVIFTFFLGVVAIIMGIYASRDGGKAGMPLVIASILFMAAGLIFSDIFYVYVRQVLEI